MNKLLSIAWALVIAGNCYAYDAPVLKITKSDGDSNVALSELLSIKYTETDMIVNMKDGSKQVFQLDDIVVMQLKDVATSINSLFADRESNDTYTITDLNGKVIASGKTSDTFSLKMKKGVFIVKIGNKTKKVIINK